MPAARPIITWMCKVDASFLKRCAFTAGLLQRNKNNGRAPAESVPAAYRPRSALCFYLKERRTSSAAVCVVCAPRSAVGLFRQLAHLGVQVGLAFESYAWQVWHGDVAIVDLHTVGEATVRLEQVRVRLITAQTQAGCDIERHLVATVRDAAARRPTVLAQHVERAQILNQAVAQCAVKLQPVAVGAHATVAYQVARVLHREQVLAGGHGILVVIAQGCLQLEVQRITWFFIPEQIIL